MAYVNASSLFCGYEVCDQMVNDQEMDCGRYYDCIRGGMILLFPLLSRLTCHRYSPSYRASS